ncbi:iron hydrogenase [Limtongia smithiae]|uniref:iron hydrogenase n=1 Tax=Limtongia smithiae TaxID=1125753 RepID=UPI0034CED965
MSAILSAQDLNDFIGPGLACINPVAVIKNESAGATEIQIDSRGNPIEVSIDDGKPTTFNALAPAQINLTDCLACSGCITSAESVLVSLQSHTELLSVLRTSRARCDDKNETGECGGECSPEEKNKKKKVFVASVAHQVRASLAAAYDISIATVDAKLVTLFRDILGFQYLVGTGVGRQISLAYSTEEVMTSSQDRRGPILASACPGWICYVEKTHPHVIPYLSAIKSPQQITGSLLKRLIMRANEAVAAGDIYHVSIMPCFDKKLEASRPDFQEEGSGVRDVDCVITTKEVVQLLIDEGLDFANIAPAANEEDIGSALSALAPPEFPSDMSWSSNEGSSSGGYLDAVLRAYAEREKGDAEIKVVPGKNADMLEFQVVRADGSIAAKAAQVYGFRNIQNLVRKLKTGGVATKRTVVSRKKAAGTATTAVLNPMDYVYVEVMACPGGCINGGGQIGMPPSVAKYDTMGQKEWRNLVETRYRSIAGSDTRRRSVAEMQRYVETAWGSHDDKLVRTAYRPVAGLDGIAAAADVPAVLVGDKW